MIILPCAIIICETVSIQKSQTYKYGNWIPQINIYELQLQHNIILHYIMTQLYGNIIQTVI